MSRGFQNTQILQQLQTQIYQSLSHIGSNLGGSIVLPPILDDFYFFSNKKSEEKQALQSPTQQHTVRRLLLSSSFKDYLHCFAICGCCCTTEQAEFFKFMDCIREVSWSTHRCHHLQSQISPSCTNGFCRFFRFFCRAIPGKGNESRPLFEGWFWLFTLLGWFLWSVIIV